MDCKSIEMQLLNSVFSELENLHKRLCVTEDQLMRLVEVCKLEAELTECKKKDPHKYEDCHAGASHNHKDFSCLDCYETYIIRDDSKINVCFTCEIFPICDKCFENNH